MTYTVDVRGICKSFAGQVVLDHVDLVVPSGTVLALLGPNGAGKTTMVRILSTLLRPDAGTATIAGHDLGTDPVGVRRSISLTGQNVAVDDVLTGRENLELMARLLHLPRASARRRTEELLGLFDLHDAADRRAGTYSGGMRRRLDLAISMLVEPALLFLDEPTNGLDPGSREQLWASVRTLVEDGVTVLLTTQYLEEADRLADTVVVLDHGGVVARGTPEELKAGLGAGVLRLRFADSLELGRAARALDAVRCDDRSRTLEVTTDASGADVLATLARLEAARAPALSVSLRSPSLDDVFRSLTDRTTARTTGRETARAAREESVR